MADGKESQHYFTQQRPLQPTYSRSLPPPPVTRRPSASSPQLSPQFLSVSPDQHPSYLGPIVQPHTQFSTSPSTSTSDGFAHYGRFRDFQLDPGLLGTLPGGSNTSLHSNHSGVGSNSSITRPQPPKRSGSTYSRDLAEAEEVASPALHREYSNSNLRSSALKEGEEYPVNPTGDFIGEVGAPIDPGVMTPQSDFSFTSESPMLPSSQHVSSLSRSHPPQVFGSLFQNHRSNIDLVSASPDGTTIASFSREDGIVITWAYRPAATIAGARRTLGKLEAKGTYRTGFVKRESSFVGTGDGGTGGRVLPPGELFLAVSNHGQFIALSSCIVASSGNMVRGQIPGQYTLRPSTPNPADSFLLLSTETQNAVLAPSFVNLYGIVEFLPTARLGVCDGTYIHILSTTNWTMLYKLDLFFLTQDIGGAWVNAFDQLQLAMSSLRFGTTVAWLEPYASLSIWQIVLGPTGMPDTIAAAPPVADAANTATANGNDNGNGSGGFFFRFSGGSQGDTPLLTRVMLGHGDTHRAFRHGKVFVRTALSTAGDLLAVYTVPLEGDIPCELAIHLIENGGIPLSHAIVTNKIDFIGFTETDHPEFTSSSTASSAGATTTTVLVTLGSTPYGEIVTEVWEPYSCTLLGSYEHSGLERASIVPWATQLGTHDGGWFVENLGKALQIHPLLPAPPVAVPPVLGAPSSRGNTNPTPSTLIRLQPGHHFSHPTETFIRLASGLHPEHKIFFAHSAQAINPEPWVANRITPDVFAYFLDRNRVLIAGDYSVQVWAFGGGRFGAASHQEGAARSWGDDEEQEEEEGYGGAAGGADLGTATNDDVVLQYIWTTPVSQRVSVVAGAPGGRNSGGAPINHYQLIQQIWVDTERADRGEFTVHVRLSQGGHKDVKIKLPPLEEGLGDGEGTVAVSVRTLRNACRAVRFLRDVMIGHVAEDEVGEEKKEQSHSGTDVDNRFWVVKQIRDIIEKGIHEHPEALSVVNGNLYPMQDWMHLGWDGLVKDLLATGRYIPCFHIVRTTAGGVVSLGATPAHTTESALTLAIALKKPAIVWALLEYMARRTAEHSGYMVTIVKALPALLINYPDYVDWLMEERLSWFTPTQEEIPRELLKTEVINGKFERSTQIENYSFAVDELVIASRKGKGKGDHGWLGKPTFSKQGKNISHPAKLYLLPLPKLFEYSEQVPEITDPQPATTTTTTTLPMFTAPAAPATAGATAGSSFWFAPTTSLFTYLALNPFTNSHLFFRHTAISSPIISFKWHAFARNRFLAIWLFHLVFFAVYAVTVSLATSSFVAAVLRVIVVIMAAMVVIQELRKLQLTGGARGYVTRIENLIRLVGAGLLPLAVVGVMIAGLQERVEVIIVVISVLFLWLNILLLLRIYKPFGVFLYRISNITQTLVFFLVLLAILVLAFAQAFYILLKDIQPTTTTTYPSFAINSVTTTIPPSPSSSVLSDGLLGPLAAALTVAHNTTLNTTTSLFNQTLTGTINATLTGLHKNVITGNITITAPQSYFQPPVIPPCPSPSLQPSAPVPRYPEATGISATSSTSLQANPFSTFDQAIKNVILLMRGDFTSLQPFWQDDDTNPDAQATTVSNQPSSRQAFVVAPDTTTETSDSAPGTSLPHSTIQLMNFLLILFGILCVLLILNFIITLLNDFLTLRYDHAEAAWLVWMICSIAEIEALWLFGRRQHRRDLFPTVIYFEDDPKHGREREQQESAERKEEEVRRENDRLLVERMEVLLGVAKLEQAVNNIAMEEAVDRADRRKSMAISDGADRRRSMTVDDRRRSAVTGIVDGVDKRRSIVGNGKGKARR